MTNDTEQLQSTVNSVLRVVQQPFYNHPDFWIGLILSMAAIAIGVFGLYYAYMAFKEAGEAKKAANAAGKTVKIQTVTIELTEILQKLGNLQPNIEFSDAWNLLTEIQRRLRRTVSPFQKDADLGDTIAALKEALSAASKALASVRPSDPAKEEMAPLAVYNAIQDNFAAITNIVADLLGLFEKKSINFGDDDGNS